MNIENPQVVSIGGVRTRRRLMTPDPQDRRPLDIIAEAGPAANPIPFDTPAFLPGRYDEVFMYFPGTAYGYFQERVLFRDYTGVNAFAANDDDVDADPMSQVQHAYWPVPNKDRMPTIMGHVQICLALEKRQQANGDNNIVVFEWRGSHVAIKVNYLNRMGQLQHQYTENAWNEIAAMQLIGNSHRNVVGCIEVLNDGENINVVMPYYNGGDLFEYIYNNNNGGGGLSEEHAKFWFRQLMAGIQHLHTVAGICHRDLSPENIVIHDNNTRCLIIDMGMAIRIPYSPSDDDNDNDDRTSVTDVTNSGGPSTTNRIRRLIRPQGRCGKLPYMSPEIYYNTMNFDGCAVDIWTAGVILFCMITGESSYERPQDSDSTYYWMVHGVDRILSNWGEQVSSECLHLLQNILQVDPRLRLSLEEILNHPWLAEEEEEPW